MPAEGNGDLQTLICVLVARRRRCSTLSNPVPWQNWMADYLDYTLRMKTLLRGWPVMVHDTHTRRRRRSTRRWLAFNSNGPTTSTYKLNSNKLKNVTNEMCVKIAIKKVNREINTIKEIAPIDNSIVDVSIHPSVNSVVNVIFCISLNWFWCTLTQVVHGARTGGQRSRSQEDKVRFGGLVEA